MWLIVLLLDGFSERWKGTSRPAIAEPAGEVPNIYPAEVPQLSIEIRDVAERRLGTVIELLSPANKHGDGAREHGTRRLELMRTETHVLDIDLLRQRTRIQLAAALPPALYYIYLSRLARRPLTQIWPVQLREPLPTVPVPLLPPDADVPLDLQAAVQACFDLVGYERLLDYVSPPPPPELSDDDTAWVNNILQTAGVRDVPC